MTVDIVVENGINNLINMNRIVIYKRKEDNSVYSVNIIPDKYSNEELDKLITNHNNFPDNCQRASMEILNDEMFDVVNFLINNRDRDLNQHLLALKGIRDNVRDIQDYLYETVNDLMEKLEKQTKSKNEEKWKCHIQ